MRPYMTNEYKKSLEGKTFTSSDSNLKQYDGLKVTEVVRELTEKDYDREAIDYAAKNENGEVRYLVNTMYEVRLENDKLITVYEDEINPDYAGSWLEANEMNDKLKYLNALDAELLKTELLAFLGNEDAEEFADMLVAYIEEDFSRGDCEE